MSAIEFEIEEAEDRELANSHLVETGCRRCGTRCLVAGDRRHLARCGSCLADVGEVEVPEDRGVFARLGAGKPSRWTAQHQGDNHARWLAGEGIALGGRAYPAPEVTSRQAWGGEGAPLPVRKLAQRAAEAGWNVRVQRSRGSLPHATHGAPGAVKTTYAVVASSGRRSFYAVNDGTTWKTIMVWSDTISWFPSCSVTDLYQWIKGHDHDQWPAWIEAIKKRVAEQEALKKRREACAKGTHDDVRGLVGPLAWVVCVTCEHGWARGAAPWKKPKAATKKDTMQ